MSATPHETKFPQPRTVTPESPGYPPLLQSAVMNPTEFVSSPFLRKKEVPDNTKPPLCMVGQPNEKPAAYLAVIGSRPPTVQDANDLQIPLVTLTEEYERRVEVITTFLDNLLIVFSEQNSPFALSLVSGLTEGGDEQAMHWALQHEVPIVGVLASPLDRIHPQGSQAIYNELVLKIILGTPGYRLVSRHPWPKGKKWNPYNSLKRDYSPDYIPRDRVVAGLASVTLAWNIRQLFSGTGYTMAVSHGLGRPVLAVAETVNEAVVEKAREHPSHVTLVNDPQPVVNALLSQPRR